MGTVARREAGRKVFAGAQVRRLRRELSLTQTAMAADLQISTSYLNLIERNQRPISAQLLLRLADIYDLDVKAFAGSDEDRLLADLKEVFSDRLFEGSGVGNAELQDLATGNPAVAQAVGTLYRAYHHALSNAAELASRLAEDGGPHPLEPQSEPAEEVRDFIHHSANHFPELETAAERLRDELPAEASELDGGLRSYLERFLGVSTRVMPIDVMGTILRRYDRHGRRLLLSEMLNPSGRTFQMAHQIALSGHGPLLDELVEAGGNLKSPVAAQLSRVALANYFAGAVMMPYEHFRQAAESLRYDIEVLGQRFGASFEQVCHRLTTMQRSGARGIPFFLIRVDNAGNISKRFSTGGFHFARFGGACPRWNVHDAFQIPDRIVTQIVAMPDGTIYFSLARTVRRTAFGRHHIDQQLAIGLGCEVSHAPKIVYADGFDLARAARIATPIGPTCRLCEREDCAQRAFPPLTRRMEVNENLRGSSAFGFSH